MGFLDRIFGEKESFGAPLKYRCIQCDKKLHAGTGGVVSGGFEVFEHMNKKALYCQNCQEIYCMDCANEAGKRRGLSKFICPGCGREIA